MATIEIYLVRHAIAEERGPEFPDDKLRPLTTEGTRRFKEAVRGLSTLGVGLDVIFTSPLIRARETATILGAGLGRRVPIEQVEALAPGGKPAAVIDAIAKRPKALRRVALVGHEPDLGELAARLLGARGGVEFKKGAVCAIDVDDATPGGPGTLRWLLPPRALRGLARR